MTLRNTDLVREKLRSLGRTSCVYAVLIKIMRGIFLCSKGLFQHLRSRNVTTVMWVLNYPDELDEVKNLFGAEMMGVMTDKPSMLN